MYKWLLNIDFRGRITHSLMILVDVTFDYLAVLMHYFVFNNITLFYVQVTPTS